MPAFFAVRFLIARSPSCVCALGSGPRSESSLSSSRTRAAGPFALARCKRSRGQCGCHEACCGPPRGPAQPVARVGSRPLLRRRLGPRSAHFRALYPGRGDSGDPWKRLRLLRSSSRRLGERPNDERPRFRYLDPFRVGHASRHSAPWNRVEMRPPNPINGTSWRRAPAPRVAPPVHWHKSATAP